MGANLLDHVYPDGRTRAGLLTSSPVGKDQADHLDITFQRNKDPLAGGVVTPHVYVTDVAR
ncbi:MAG TPA: hypothetical protein VH475_18055 [Tepidisphaeraceae bacterium]